MVAVRGWRVGSGVLIVYIVWGNWGGRVDQAQSSPSSSSLSPVVPPSSLLSLRSLSFPRRLGECQPREVTNKLTEIDISIYSGKVNIKKGSLFTGYFFPFWIPSGINTKFVVLESRLIGNRRLSGTFNKQMIKTLRIYHYSCDVIQTLQNLCSCRWYICVCSLV